MPGIFRDGFDGYNNASSAAPNGLRTKWQGALTGVVLVAGRFGGQAISINSTNSSNTNCYALFDATTATLSANVGIRSQNSYIGTIGRTSITFLNTALTPTLGLQFLADGSIVAIRCTGAGTGVELGRTAPGVVASSIWYSLAMEAVISDTVGRVTLWLDGTQVLNLTNVDTNNAVGSVGCVWLGGQTVTASSFDFDDLYITDSATKPTKDVRVQTLVPVSDGAVLNLTPSTGTQHFATVDELPVSATDYLSGTNVGDRDILGLQDLSATPSTIEEVAVVGYLAKTDAATRSMNLGVVSGATTSDGPAQNLNSSGLRHERGLATDPNTGAAWTAAAVNALQLQPKVAA